MNIGFGNQGSNYYFWRGCDAPSFEVPKGSGKNANGGTILCVGAFDENEKLHISKYDPAYDEFNFQPGPLDTTNCSTNETEMLKFDRLWNLNRWHIEEFQYHFEQGNVQNGSYVPHPDILSWPAHGTPGTNQARNLARFVDVNNNGIYNPIEEGDYPFLFGDQTIFTIFNDSTASDVNSYMPDLGLEIHQYAYAFTCPENTNQDSILNYTFFMHYDVFNRSNNNYRKMAFGYFQYPYFQYPSQLLEVYFLHPCLLWKADLLFLPSLWPRSLQNCQLALTSHVFLQRARSQRQVLDRKKNIHRNTAYTYSFECSIWSLRRKSRNSV
jgi:hypothetical protein